VIKKINFPTFLTLLRLILSPCILPLALVYLLPYNFLWLNSLLTLFFVFLSLTDFFDGYLARKYNWETKLGRALDPIADKFLVSSTLIALLAVKKINFIWVLIIIGREFFLMGLRQIALENNFSISVSFWGKLKTSLQLIMLSFIILNPYQDYGINFSWNILELFLILLAILISIYSAFQYYCEFKKSFIKVV